MKHLRSVLLSVFVLGLTAVMGVPVHAQSKKSEAAERTVQGVVSDGAGAGIEGAVVQIKNKRSLQIRSFITDKAGNYFFNGLSPDVDYELNASFKGTTNVTKTLGQFDTRKQATLNFKLDQ